ncbi:hypothetical protein PTKIN_Ptkin05aG0203500 [Pterospermum kingtungense]
MKVKKKGRVHPSLSSSPPPASFRDPNSVLKLLPVAILALASALPPQDREVLAYMITRSIVSTTNLSTLTHGQPKSKCKKRKAHVFQCGCFDCYTRFWHRWDCSPNRDLIHQVIEAFEDHLMQKEVPKNRCKASSTRKRDDKVSDNPLQIREQSQGGEMEMDLMVESGGLVEAENRDGCEPEREENVGEVEVEVVAVATGVSHKGLARKVLPGVVGLLNSRLWSLWGPSI